MTRTATFILAATGLRLRLVFMPLLPVLLNVGYSIGAIFFLDNSEVANWIATS